MKSVIELVKTANGYAVVEKGEQINKVHAKPNKEKTHATTKKFVQQNFTIYPYIYTQDVDSNHKYIIMPAKSQWFSFTQIHQIEKKALPQWFKTRKVVFGSVKPDKFEKNEDLYKRYRNYIIDLGKTQYVSATKARKGLAGDACAIMRIHSFLEKWGLINYIFPKRPLQNELNSAHKDGKEPDLKIRKDCIDKDKTIYEKHFDKDYFELMKKITKKFRPLCHLCEGICGVIWYEYEEELTLKKIEEVPKKNGEGIITELVKDSLPFPYTLRLCASCLNGGNIPIILTVDNFSKRTLLDNLKYRYEEPREKKKIAEQNKLLETIQKNRFNIKKSAEFLKLSEQELYESLLYIPLVKIEKMSRIDADTDAEQSRIQNQKNNEHHVFLNGVHQQQDQSLQVVEEKDLLKLFLLEKEKLQHEETKLYEEFIQRWLLKISAKAAKLSEWEKGTKWYGNRLINDQKNALAQALKQKL